MIVAAHATTPRKGERREGGNRRDASKGDANEDSRFFLAPNKNARRKTKRFKRTRDPRERRVVASRSAAPGDDTLRERPS